jgi:hypothetical protein
MHRMCATVNRRSVSTRISQRTRFARPPPLLASLLANARMLCIIRCDMCRCLIYLVLLFVVDDERHYLAFVVDDAYVEASLVCVRQSSRGMRLAWCATTILSALATINAITMVVVRVFTRVLVKARVK